MEAATRKASLNPRESLSRSRVIVHGAPVPALRKSGRRRCGVSLYVDGFIVVALENLLYPRTVGSARRLRDKMKRRLLKRGVGCHKEEDGSPLKTVGIMLGGEPTRVSPVESRRWLAVDATAELVSRDSVTVDMVEPLTGFGS